MPLFANELKTAITNNRHEVADDSYRILFDSYPDFSKDEKLKVCFETLIIVCSV